MKLEPATRKRLKVGGWISLGVIALLWFYFFYPRQHPYSLIHSAKDKQEVREKGAEMLHQFGYEEGNFQLIPELRQNTDLIDRLQRLKGRSDLIRTYKMQGSGHLLPLFYWQVNMKIREKEGQQEKSVNGNGDADEDDEVDPLHYRFNQDGELLEVNNDDQVWPDHSVDKTILKKIGLWPSSKPDVAPTDTAVHRLLNFSISPPLKKRERKARPSHIDSLSRRLIRGKPISVDQNIIERMARAQLSRFFWKEKAFRVDTIYMQTPDVHDMARIEMQRRNPLLKHNVRLEMNLASTGSLIALDVDYDRVETSQAEKGGTSNIWELIRFGFMLLLSLFILVLFYRRLKIRVVDTTSALLVGIAGGLLLSLHSGLFLYGEISASQMSSLWEYLLAFVVMAGVGGALATLAFFVLTGVSESITRQTWQQKLEVYNLVRQGLLLNKPVGYALLYALLFSILLAAGWTLFLQANPSVGIGFGSNGSQNVYYEGFISLAPFYLLAKLGWMSLLALLVGYTTMGSIVYKYSNRLWVSVLAMAGSVAMLPLLPLDLLPPYMEIVGTFAIATGIALSYVYREAITALLTLFLFLLLLHLDTAWIPADSPDFYLLYLLGGLYVTLAGFGTLAVIRGRPERQLPYYVPEYVEELAREERMKQELEIAQRVQQDFLPVHTPEIYGWDMAAVCRPAYETGGDYYDFIQIDEKRMAVAIGDVSGKGIEAAFYMTFVKGVLHSLAYEIDSPSNLLKKANRLFYQNSPRGTFISLVYGIIDLERNSFSFARAGHNPVLFRNAEISEFSELKPSGIGLGMNRGDIFNETIGEQELEFKPGDILILYTDGMVEAVNRNREFFGYDRFLDTFKHAPEVSANEIINHTTDRLEQFIGNNEQHDDMTMIVIKRND